MPIASSVAPAAPSFSANVSAGFQRVLEVQGIRPKEQEYYHRWVDSWMKSGGLESVEATRRFFDGLLGRTHLCDWQFVQAARAVRICACEVHQCAWAGRFDWVSLEREAGALGSSPAKLSQGSRQVDLGALPRIKVSDSQVRFEGQQAGRTASESAETATLLSADQDARATTFTTRSPHIGLRPKRFCWRKDLSLYRGLKDAERAGFLVLLEWFENFRLRHELVAGREARRRYAMPWQAGQ